MHLTSVALRFAKPLPKGNIFKGKYRLVKKVTPLLAANKRAELELEDKNMFYLRHPFLTEEQCEEHDKIFLQRDNLLQKIKEEDEKVWKKDKLLGDRFGFLKVADKWE